MSEVLTEDVMRLDRGHNFPFNSFEDPFDASSACHFFLLSEEE